MNLKKLTIAGAIVVLGLLAYLVWKNMHKPDTEALVSGNGRIEGKRPLNPIPIFNSI